jgi:hypothetical protein
MKLQITRTALLSAFILLSPLALFSRGESTKTPDNYKAYKAEDRAGITRSIQQGRAPGTRVEPKQADNGAPKENPLAAQNRDKQDTSALRK